MREKLPFGPWKDASFAERKATMVVITLRVMIRHAERDAYYGASRQRRIYDFREAKGN